MHSDTIIRASAADGQLRAFAARTTDLAEEARCVHGCTPVAAAALGRTLTAAAMMGVDMKEAAHRVSVIIHGGGPLGQVVALADGAGHVKGYVTNPGVDVRFNDAGKLDVGWAVGAEGTITVIKDLGLKVPYAGQTPLVSGEIGIDLARYFAESEQKPSAVALGVLVAPEGHVLAAGGCIIQPMPGTDEAVIADLERRIQALGSISHRIHEGTGPEDILGELLGGYDPQYHTCIFPRYTCDCSRERLAGILRSMDREELLSMIREDKGAEMVCHYCNTKYTFNEDELKALLAQAGEGGEA
jgi:molecular chaperone Hsp33